MKYVIYKNKKKPTQSGKKKKDYWVLESFDVKEVQEDLLTGWKGSKNKSGIKLKFNNEQEAVDYAEKNYLNFVVLKEGKKETKIKSYADNFKYKRIRTDI